MKMSQSHLKLNISKESQSNSCLASIFPNSMNCITRW
jgi:hypothetical protein